MAKVFQAIGSKVKPSDIGSLRVEFTRAMGERYKIRALTNDEQFYNVPVSPLEILVSVKVLSVGLSFPLTLS